MSRVVALPMLTGEELDELARAIKARADELERSLARARSDGVRGELERRLRIGWSLLTAVNEARDALLRVERGED